MRVMLATICINEMEWLPRLWEQHRDWPGLVGWCFVEGADPVFRATNPDAVSRQNLSVDGTTEFLQSLMKKNRDAVQHVTVGVSNFGAADPAEQHKCLLRNCYLALAADLKPDIIVVLDADEFYARADQFRINEIIHNEMCCKDLFRDYTAYMFRQRHIWYPPHGLAPAETTAETNRLFKTFEPASLFSQEVVGGYWAVPHTRVWRYVPGMAHVRNHNWPEVDGRYLTEDILRADLEPGTPECVHMGYASSQESRRAKHAYYVARGEGSEGGRIGKKRGTYLDCRAAWESWRPGDTLPHGARVVPYAGPVPEAFRV